MYSYVISIEITIFLGGKIHMENDQNKTNTLEMKQTFLSNAISDMSTYIQLADTKVSIIMAAVVAILVELQRAMNQ